MKHTPVVQQCVDEILSLYATNKDLLEACKCAYNSIRRGFMFDTKRPGGDTDMERDMIKVLLEQAIRKAEK